ncbi:hypothetical protein [Paenibacillus dendritiformis]|uniref:hypothetical protein n=1 Tax=Paenibacillus dendritiformis TaxID=130049 RepID=UPI00387E0B05
MSGFLRKIAPAVSDSLGRNRMTWRPGDGRRRVEGAGQLPEVMFDRRDGIRAQPSSSSSSV